MDQARPEKSNGCAADYSPCPLASPGGHAFCGCRYVKSLDSYDAIETRISGAFARFSHAASAEVGLDFIGDKFVQKVRATGERHYKGVVVLQKQ